MFRRNPTFQQKYVLIFISPCHYTTSSLCSIIRHNLSLHKPEECLPHFLKWQNKLLPPDKFTIPSLIKLSSALGKPLLHGEHFHGHALKSGHLHDLFIITGLVEMYFKHSQFDSTSRMFDEITVKDVVFFTSMISGFAQNGYGSQALDFFSKMLEEGIEPNNITVSTALSASSQLQDISLGRSLHCYALRRGTMDNSDIILQTSLLNMYAKSGYICCVRKIFERMLERNSVSWNLIIEAYFTNGSFELALDLFKEIAKAGWKQLESSTLSLVLRICSVSTDLRKGKEIHGCIVRRGNGVLGAESLSEWNSVVDMYAKTGSLSSAVLLFERMPERNTVTWTTMISGYGIHGLSRKALEAFEEMKESGVSPDGVSFIAVLSACSHGGLVEEGQKIFLSMKMDYSIIPQMKHYVCMVDLYGRAGRLDEAFVFVSKMPIEPSKFIWGSLLSSCRKHKNLELGEVVIDRVLQLDQFDSGNYMLICRIYADAGRWEGVARVRLKMKELGVKAVVACSWVEMIGRVYRFTVNDCSSPVSRKIYDLLQNLMEKFGFVADTSNAAHNVDVEHKIIDLCGHTEKLALAFSLIRVEDEKIIRIGKNLRVCGDCHEFFKLVSRVCERDIVLKDPNRYHRFTQGCCSCHDFW